MTEELPIDLPRLLSELEGHGVEYVIVGGIAALLHGASRPTSDVDLLIESSGANIERFLGVCKELRMRNRTGNEELDIQLAERAAERQWYVSDVQDIFWSAQSDAGPIDVLPTMAMAHGRVSFAAIAEKADEVLITTEPALRVKVASIDQLIESKQTLGREKDRVVVEELRSLTHGKHLVGQIEDRVDAAMACHEASSDPTEHSIDSIEKFEIDFGHRLPAAFRYFLLRFGDAGLLPRHCPYGDYLRYQPWVGLVSDLDWERQEMARIYLDEDAPSGWGPWLRKLVKFAEQSNDAVCLDFSFDSINPPVILIDYERGGLDDYNRELRYVAGSFLEYIELEVDPEDGSIPDDENRVSNRMVAWYQHRDLILGSRRDARQIISSPTIDQVDWPDGVA